MHHQHIKIIADALSASGIPFVRIDGFPDAIMVKGKPFVRAATPFNSESSAALFKDKDAVYRLLDGRVRMPRTKSFLDPNGKHPDLADAKTLEEMVERSSDILYPRIVKMNRGDNGNNVFLCQDDRDTLAALRNIFDRSSRNYDYIALVQERIMHRREYRALVVNGELAFTYDRDTAKMVEDEDRRLENFLRSILERVWIGWGSIDILESDGGELYFLEINSMPGFDRFIEANGTKEIETLFLRAMHELL